MGPGGGLGPNIPAPTDTHQEVTMLIDTILLLILLLLLGIARRSE